MVDRLETPNTPFGDTQGGQPGPAGCGIRSRAGNAACRKRTETGEPGPIHSPWRPSTAALPMTASGIILRRIACRHDLFQQRSRARDPGTQRTHPSTQRRVGGVNQSRRWIRKGAEQLHDAIISAITAAMPGMLYDKALVRRHHAGRGGTVEDNCPCASAAEHEWGNLGDKPLRSLSTVSPPAVRTRAHHVVAIHEHSGLRGLVHVACG